MSAAACSGWSDRVARMAANRSASAARPSRAATSSFRTSSSYGPADQVIATSQSVASLRKRGFFHICGRRGERVPG